MEYTHAKDYLIELANGTQTHGWLKDLIIRTINTNGHLSDEDLSLTTIQLKSNSASTLTVPNTENNNHHADIRFISLTHNTGVCALANDQTIIFSKDITLLYGNNGSGKSSYFRILNEIIGGNHKTELRPNIYANTNNSINIRLNYAEGDSVNELSWDGTTRAISPLNLSSVFDSNYTMAFLQKRSADTAIVLPYGLHLFTALTTAMDNIKGRLQTEIDGVLKSLPQINTEGLSDDVIRILAQQTYRSSQKKYIQDRYIISSEQDAELNKQKEELKKLQETNYNDKIIIAKSELAQYEALKKHLTATKEFLQQYESEARSLISRVVESRKKSEDVKQKIAVLSEIGNTDSEEWKTFIETGAKFVQKTNLNKDVCPYCRQPLVNEAIHIISSYETYLTDKSFSELNQALTSKEILRQKISNITTDYTISEQFKTLIDAETSIPNFYNKISEILHIQREQKLLLINDLDTVNVNSPLVFETTEELISCIKGICDKYNANIANLHEEQTKKDEKATALSLKMKSLIEYKAISTQKELFSEWFDKMKIVDELKGCQAELSTRHISVLAKTASQTLVTDNLKNKFQEELNALGLKKLSVDLSEAGASRGQSFMQLRLVNNNPVTEILSEGEQKGVALALFIAERRMQLSKNPIILDDPVNSLDHFITAKLVERLSSLGNQIIIFSHNLLLQTSLASLKGLHECGANQISSCKKDTKHLFMYSVNSYGRDKKGVIVELKQDNIANNLLAANKRLKEEPFSRDCSIAVGAILRHTIELIIDEKIFHNQIPVKFHGRKNSIQWEQLKALNPDASIIDKLNALFSRLSGGDLHSGIEQSTNPIEHDELEDIYKELLSISH